MRTVWLLVACGWLAACSFSPQPATGAADARAVDAASSSRRDATLGHDAIAPIDAPIDAGAVDAEPIDAEITCGGLFEKCCEPGDRCGTATVCSFGTCLGF